jgi:hypothetical protein
VILSCLQNDPGALASSQRLISPSYQSIFPLTVGNPYPVLGMMLFSSILYVLVEDDSRSPLMAPAAMFSDDLVAIPEDWLFKTREGLRPSLKDVSSDETMAIWGYDELVTDKAHFPALTEWEPNALRIFRERVQIALGGSQ